MRQILFLLSFVPLVLSSCGGDDIEENNPHKSGEDVANLSGRTFYGKNTERNQYDHSYTDAQFQKIYNALNYLPTNLYETSYDHKDTLITDSDEKTTRYELKFISSSKAYLKFNEKTIAMQQNAHKWHNHYCFPEDYVFETSFYMYNINRYTFDYYDKRSNMRTAFRLDNNRCYDLVYYIKEGAQKQNTYTYNREYDFSYIYDEQEKRFEFYYEDAEAGYGYYSSYNTQKGIEESLDFFYNDGTKSISFSTSTDSY